MCVIKDLYFGTVVRWKTQARPTADLVVSTVRWAVEKSSRQDGKPKICILIMRVCTPATRTKMLATLRFEDEHGTGSDQCRQCFGRECVCTVETRVGTSLSIRTRQEATERINQYFLNTYNPWQRMPISTQKPNTKEALDERTKGAV